MDPLKRKRRKWIIFGSIIAVIAVLAAVGPVMVTKYTRYKINNPKNPVTRELKIKVKGTVKHSVEEEKVYLAGDNGLYYVLIGDRAEEIVKDVDKKVSVFGSMYSPIKDETVEGSPVRLRIYITEVEYLQQEPQQQDIAQDENNASESGASQGESV